MAKLCRFAAYVEMCSAIAGSDRAVPACDQPAAYTAISRIEPADGIGLHLDAEVCEEHNRKISAATHYERSIKLRQPAADPPAMCESPWNHDLCDHD